MRRVPSMTFSVPTSSLAAAQLPNRTLPLVKECYASRKQTAHTLLQTLTYAASRAAVLKLLLNTFRKDTHSA